jgi:hypothetical protein
MANHEISLNDAVAMTDTYRANCEGILDSNYQSQNVLPLSETFELDQIKTLWENNPDAKYLRIYYGMDESYRIHAILVAANDENADILPGDPDDTDSGLVYENSMRCPTACPPSSALNS